MIATIIFKGGPWDGIINQDVSIPQHTPGAFQIYTRLTGVEQAKWDNTVWKHRYSDYALIQTPDPSVFEGTYIASEESYHTHFAQIRQCKCMEPLL